MNKIINSIYANLYKEPTFKSELVNQSLYCDEVHILDESQAWSLVELYDGYLGWVHSFYLSNSLNEEYEFYLVDSQYSNNQFSHLSFGTSLPIISKNNDKIKSFNPTNEYDWYSINKKSFPSKRDEIVFYAKQFLGVPYLWGGRSSFGIDCSGLIQLVLYVANIRFPRDTSEQISCDTLEEIDLGCAMLGDIVFFADNSTVNHVGLYIGNDEIIHSSGRVKCESLDISAINFSKKLKRCFYKIFSINNLIYS
tara:strand:- start:6 stop:761 length:756 start_codon:yes stop_codon:yes gene_type:complete